MGANSPDYSRAYYERNKDRIKAQAAEANKRKRIQHRQNIHAYLLAHPCVDCGEADPIVLEFDHRDPVEKSFDISTAASTTWKWETIEAEIAKCDVRCCNCHRRRTHAQRQLGELCGNGRSR